MCATAEQTLEIVPQNTMYKNYKEQALLASSALGPNRSIPIIVNTWLNFEASQVKLYELKRLQWKSDTDNKWIRILVAAYLDTGSEAMIADSQFFKFFRETACKNIKITGLYGDSRGGLNKHKMIHAYIMETGMVEIIECDRLRQLKYIDQLRAAAATQLGVDASKEDLLGLGNKQEILVLLPVAVAGAVRIDPMSLGLANPVFSPGLVVSRLLVCVGYQLHGTLGVAEEDFEGPMHTWPIFRPTLDQHKMMISKHEHGGSSNTRQVTCLTTCINPECNHQGDMSNFINTQLRCVRCSGCLDCITIQTTYVKSPKNLQIAKTQSQK